LRGFAAGRGCEPLRWTEKSLAIGRQADEESPRSAAQFAHGGGKW